MYTWNLTFYNKLATKNINESTWQTGKGDVQNSVRSRTTIHHLRACGAGTTTRLTLGGGRISSPPVGGRIWSLVGWGGELGPDFTGLGTVSPANGKTSALSIYKKCLTGKIFLFLITSPIERMILCKIYYHNLSWISCQQMVLQLVKHNYFWNILNSYILGYVFSQICKRILVSKKEIGYQNKKIDIPGCEGRVLLSTGICCTGVSDGINSCSSSGPRISWNKLSEYDYLGKVPVRYIFVHVYCMCVDALERMESYQAWSICHGDNFIQGLLLEKLGQHIDR